MATIYANTQDGYVARLNQSTWSNARANSSGTTGSSTGVAFYQGISGIKASSRGGGSVYTIYRSFMAFDVSGISANVDSATLKIYGFNQSSGDLIAVKATSDIQILGTADFEAIEGWDSSGTDGSGGGDMESSVTKYSDEITTWSTSGYNDIALNSDALSDMTSGSTFNCVLIGHDYDYLDQAPSNADYRINFYQDSTAGTSSDPYIDYTVATTAADNAIFFGTNF